MPSPQQARARASAISAGKPASEAEPAPTTRLRELFDGPRLSPGQRRAWLTATESLPSSFFGREAAPLLLQYARHVDRLDSIEGALAKMAPEDEEFDRMSRLAIVVGRHVAMLARSLRLAPNTRTAPIVAAHALARGAGPRGIEALLRADVSQ